MGRYLSAGMIPFTKSSVGRAAPGEAAGRVANMLQQAIHRDPTNSKDGTTRSRDDRGKNAGDVSGSSILATSV